MNSRRLFPSTFTAAGCLTMVLLLLSPILLIGAAAPASPLEQQQRISGAFLKDGIARPLRYTPDGTDFVITNGAEFFNRPLYGGHTAFRVDGGDKPEFSLYQPGHGGNLRLGMKTASGYQWFNNSSNLVTRYRPGSLIHEIATPAPEPGIVRLTTLGLTSMEGLIVRAELINSPGPVELIWAFGGVDGKKGSREGDIGCEREPVSRFFQLSSSQCEGNTVSISGSNFRVKGKGGEIAGISPSGARLFEAAAANWNNPSALFSTPDAKNKDPLLAGSAPLHKGTPIYLALTRGASKSLSTSALPALFESEEKQRKAVAERVRVETPDPFINAAAASLNVAADAVWDERAQAFMHGAVAWRVRLLGWRGAYAGDTLGWHDRSAAHFAGYAKQQNTNLIPAIVPPPDEDSNLSRSEVALHSNGDLTKSHYDMNLAGMDVLFRHLLWTGDLDYAERMWPVIERHIAWEKRLFRREFGNEKLPLYEAYCCIWASDDLAYHGGGVTHSSAFNYWHNRMAARVARLIGKDPDPYDNEADLIAKALRQELWLRDRGWFGEWKDVLGRKLVHPNAAAWTFYHTLDCEVPSPMEAWQMTRYVDTQLSRIPLYGPGVPEGCHTMPTTSWMPYSWSLNNVVLAEVMHSALAYWQAGRPEGAFPLFKGAVLDSMFLGLCPGNVGMCTYFDAYRRESQRDFADGAGIMSRALVEGLFGIQPDMLAGELRIRPGFPAEWKNASMQHPDFSFRFQRINTKDVYDIRQKFSNPMKLRLHLPAARDQIAQVTINGSPAQWSPVDDAVGSPQIIISGPAAARHEIAIEWSGRALETKAGLTGGNIKGTTVQVTFKADEVMAIQDPQKTLEGMTNNSNSLEGKLKGVPGHHTVFAKLKQGAMQWWQPVNIEILPKSPLVENFNWKLPIPGSSKLETLDLSPVFNAKVTDIFRNEYRSPRSPYCSLALPKQGIGAWCHPKDQFEVDDSGLRLAADKSGGKISMPNGVPFATPGNPDSQNIVFVSQWDNYPRSIDIALKGKARRAFLLMAGSTSAMQCRFDNGEIIVTYTDGSTTRLALHNPTTWWPIDQDYYVDDYAFARPEPLPARVDLQTGRIRVLDMAVFKGQGRKIAGGSATALTLPLDESKELKSLTVGAIANEVVIGLMSVTLSR